MTLHFEFPFPLPAGLHARPASFLRERAQGLAAHLTWTNTRNGRQASLASLLSLLATDTRPGDPCRLEASGPDAPRALETLRTYLAGDFLACDPPPATQGLDSRPPRGTAVHQLLAQHPAPFWSGTPVAPGLAIAPLRFCRDVPLDQEDVPPSGPPEAEAEALMEGLRRLRKALEADIAAAAHSEARAILEAHLAMAQDETWVAALRVEVLERGRSAPSAVVRASREAARPLLQSESPYLQERAQDLQDLARRLLGSLSGEAPEEPVPELTSPAILVADTLLPSRFLALDRRHLKGLVLTEGGGTSHTAVLARSFGIPCVADVPSLRVQARPGEEAILDGRRGLVITQAPAPLRAYYDLERRGHEAWSARLAAVAAEPCRTRDGRVFTVRANIATPEEATAAVALGADGVGLFRTEMLFLQRPSAPSEEEQFQAYREALAGAQGRPLVLRLLDAGGDKPLPCLALPREANPFLGRRAVRWYPDQEALVRTQIRAALRASSTGDLRLMVPMVSEVEELRWVRARVEEVAAELPGQTIPPLGIMVEVPSAALNARALAREADFLCVGTNDLIQYLFAADRTDPRVAKASHAWHPATLRCLKAIVEGARAEGKPVSLCGELAAQPRMLPILVGLGLEDVSVAPAAVPEIKAAAAHLDPAACQTLVEAALEDATAREVEERLEHPGWSADPRPILEPDLIVLDAPCATKEEAIKLLVERLHAQGRVRDPLELEEAVWDRERTYATHIGFGFAVPHGTSPSVLGGSLAILRTAAPLDWNPEDPAPVRCVLLLALGRGEGNDLHLRVFAKLARRLMDPAFRDLLLLAEDPDDLAARIRSEIPLEGPFLS
jgi:multiphosphoryl transfer protein